MRLILLLVAAGMMTVCLVPGCDDGADGDGDADGDVDGDADGDIDGDVDGDADGDVDGDVDGDGDGDPGLCAGLEPGDVLWSWPSEDLGPIVQSNVADGRLSVLSLNESNESVLNVLDAATGELIEAFPLTGADAPDRRLLDVGPPGPVGTAVFAARDELGRTYIMHTPSSGDETSIPTMVYRYEADGTRAFGIALDNSVHGSLLIEHDGDGGAIIEAYREPGVGRFVARIANDGTLAWEYMIPGDSELGGFVIDGANLWVTGQRENADGVLLPWVGQVSLETGLEAGTELYLPDADSDFMPERVALAPGGDFYLFGFEWTIGNRRARLYRVSASGEVEWREDTSVAGWANNSWTMDLDTHASGDGVCATTPEPEVFASRVENIACFLADSEEVLRIEGYMAGGSEGGMDVDPLGHIHAFSDEGWPRVNTYCSPFVD